jgi:plastocyanin
MVGSSWRGGIQAVGLVGLGLLALARPAAGQAGDGAGSVHGSITLVRKGILGRAAPASDRGGVVVYLTGFARPAQRAQAFLEQEDETFHPRILPIVRGQEVVFPNRDPIYHNVFSVSPVHSFDLGQYKSTDTPREQVFDAPGLVPVYCNIHPRMIAYVVVLENDAFALTDADGRFAIENAPTGRHSLHAWTPGAERVSWEVDVQPGAATELELELAVGRIPPHRRKDGSGYPRPGYEAER